MEDKDEKRRKLSEEAYKFMLEYQYENNKPRRYKIMKFTLIFSEEEYSKITDYFSQNGLEDSYIKQLILEDIKKHTENE